MANCCSTDIWLNGAKEKISLINDVFECLYGDHHASRGLSRILTEVLGFTEDSNEYKAAWGRGRVVCWDYFDEDDDVSSFHVVQDDAWTPQIGPVKALADRFDVELTFLGIEEGCGVYWSNDPYYIGNYLIDIPEPEEMPEAFSKSDYDFVSPEKLKSMLSACVEEDTLDNMLARFLELYGEYASINMIEEYQI